MHMMSRLDIRCLQALYPLRLQNEMKGGCLRFAVIRRYGVILVLKPNNQQTN